MTRLPEHHETCSYRRGRYNLWTNCTCRTKFNDRQFGYWQRMARQLVIKNLVQAADAAPSSIVGHLVASCLIQLSDGESPELTHTQLIKEDKLNLLDLLKALRSNQRDVPHPK